MTFHSHIRPKKESSLIDNNVKHDDKEFYDLLKVITTSTTIKSNMSIVLKYFHSLSSFKNIISKIFPEINLFLQLLCENIEFEYSKANSILFRQNSVDEMMYVLIKGTLISLSKSCFKVMITKKQYLSYLIKLKLYNEDDLLKLTIENMSNYEKYPLDIKDFSGITPFPNEGTTKINDRSDLFTEIELGDDYKIMFDNIISSTSKKNVNRTRKSMFRFKLDKDLYKNVYKKCNEYNKINKYYLDRISEYIELDNNDNVNEKYMFFLYKYIENGYFRRGATFGNFLLESKYIISKERTIISKDNTYFAVISKKLYKVLLLEANKRLMSQNIISLMKYSLFDKIKYKSFEHKINPNIEYKKLYRGDILGCQDEEMTNIFFIKSGEFMIKFHGGYDDIYALFSKYSKFKVEYDLSSFEKYKKIIKDYIKPIKFNIKIVKDYGIFGFEDSCIDGRLLFDIVCYSNEGEVFYTNRKYFIENVILHINHENISKFHDTCMNNMKNIINLVEESLKFRVIKDKEKDYQLKESFKKQSNSQSKASWISQLSQEKITKDNKSQVLSIKNIKKSNRNLIFTCKINKNSLNYDKFMNKQVESYKKDVDSIIENGIGMILNSTRSLSKDKYMNNTINKSNFQKERLINKIDMISSCNYNNKLYKSVLFSEKHMKKNEESSYYYNINTNNNTYSNDTNHTINNTYININNSQTNNIINSYYYFEKKNEDRKNIYDNHIKSSLINSYTNNNSKQTKNIIKKDKAYKSMSNYKFKSEENLNEKQKMKLSNTFFIAHMIKRNKNIINK